MNGSNAFVTSGFSRCGSGISVAGEALSPFHFQSTPTSPDGQGSGQLVLRALLLPTAQISPPTFVASRTSLLNDPPGRSPMPLNLVCCCVCADATPGTDAT